MESTASALWQQTNGQTQEQQRRNFVLGVLNGIGYNLYIVVLNTEVVMTLFLSRLTTSNLLISLMVPIELGSWYFLQLVLSGYVQRRAQALPLYRSMGVVRLVALALLVLAAFTLDASPLLLLVFLLLFALNSLAAGVAALPFMNTVAKTIPPTRRGMYFGWRRFLGGGLGLLGGWLVKIILAPDFALGFPANYGLLFSLGFVFMLIIVISFSLVQEPPEAPQSERIKLGQQVRRALDLPRRDRNYARYLAVRVCMILTTFALPFYTVYARRVLVVPEDTVGIYLIGMTLTSVLSNQVLGRLGDRWGNRLVVRVAALSAILPPVTALGIAFLPGGGWNKGLAFSLVFLLQGIHATANVIGSSAYLLELSPSIERVLYIGLAHGVIGLALFTSPLGGAMVDILGFEALFVFASVAGLASALVSIGLQEPRQQSTVDAR